MHIVNSAILEQWNVLTDAQVVARVLTGQTALFEVLMRRHNERLYRAARAITRDDQDAEDAMLQAYLNAYARLREFKSSGRFDTWLTRIVIDEAVARVRRPDPIRCQYPDLSPGAFSGRDLSLRSLDDAVEPV